MYSIILSTGRTYGRFVVVVPEEEGAFVETEQELMVRSSLSRSIPAALMMRERGWRQQTYVDVKKANHSDGCVATGTKIYLSSFFNLQHTSQINMCC